MKRILSLLITLSLVLPALPGLTGSGLAANWADPYLNNLVTRSVMKGDPDGQLYPNRSVTRAEFAAMLNRAFGFYEPGTAKFRDVAPTAWYAADISIAAGQGYLQGDSTGANPAGNLTREEAAAMLCRALKIPPLEGEQFRLTDERSFSNWSRGYINAAVERGFVNGYPNGSFQPKNRITRGEAAKMLSQVAGEIRSSATQSRLDRTVSGNLTISSSSVTLSDVTVTGDLYITEGVGLGYVKLENVTVLGEMIVSGAGESNVGASSIILTNCDIPRLTVDVAKRKILTLKTDGTTRVGEAVIKSSTYLEELSRHYEGFDKVILDAPAKSFLNLRGSFGDVTLLGQGSVLSLYQGQIGSITVDEAAAKSSIALEKDTYVSSIYFDAGAAVTGAGEIGSVLVNNDGTTIAQLPEDIYIRPGVTATIGGKKMGFLDAEMDSLSPAFTGDYPKVDLLTPTGFTLLYMSNKPGKAYYGVYPAETSRPSLEELTAKPGTAKTALKQGTLNTLPDKELKASVSGLKAGVQYVVYSVFVDLRGEASSISRAYVTTVDNVIPTLLSGYPKVADLGPTHATFALIPNKAASFYWAVLPDKSTAPTADQLYKQTVSGATRQGVTRGGQQNVITEIALPEDAFKESVTYTFYVVLGDAAGNLSKAPVKLAFTTKDTTAPRFLDDYPQLEKASASSLTLAYMVNEPCAVYWMVTREDTVILTSDKSKVKTGTGAYTNGKTTLAGKASAAKAAAKYSLSPAGLEAERPYHIHFVLEDAAGNLSDVTSLPLKTADTKAPTATVTAPRLIGGKFPIDGPVTVTFSEIVCGAESDASGSPKRLSDIFKDATNKKVLDNYIQLVNANDPKAQPLAIPWSRVTVRDYNGQTEIIFPGAAYDDAGRETAAAALPLSNDAKYQLVLAHNQSFGIRDSSNNPMAEKTRLEFTTVPPLTYFYVERDVPAQFDQVFYLQPDQQKIGDNIRFNLFLHATAEQEIQLEVYKASTLEGLSSAASPITCTLGKDGAGRSMATPLFTAPPLYKDLTLTYYGIKITKVGNVSVQNGSPLTIDFELRMRGVIGSQSELAGLSGTESDFEKKLASSLCSNVTTPTSPFTLRLGLVDSKPPVVVGAVEVLPADVSALMQLKTDKACTVYYLVMLNEDGKAPATLTPEEIKGVSAPPRSLRGSFPATGGSISAEWPITGLSPEKNYRVYLYLKGEAPGASAVSVENFTTKVVTPPKISLLKYAAGERSAEVTSQWDADCTVYYVVYLQSVSVSHADDIINPPLVDRVAAGTFSAKKDLSSSILVPGLHEGIKYQIHMVAQRFIGTLPVGGRSEIVSLGPIIAKDTIPPFIATNPPNYTLTAGTRENTFSGQVSVTFSEPLYFTENDMTAKPLSIRVFEEAMSGLELARIKLNPSSSKEDFLEGEPEGRLISIGFSYTNLSPGSTIELNKKICDRTGNIAGQFLLKLTPNPDPDKDPIWTASFHSGQ